MSLGDAILGKPVPPSESKKESLSVWTGVPVLGLDALASTGYGPEAALTILSVAGIAGLHYFFFILIPIVFQLGSLYFSYRQTSEAYPHGGGAYSVTKDNFGEHVAVWAAVALLLDYLLNVAVAISAGVGVVVSAVPRLHPYTLPLCLFVLLTLTIVNLRGVRQSGLVFVLPTFGFVACIAVSIAIGLVRIAQTGGHPHPVVAPASLPHATAALGGWLLLTAFANGCTAMTGIEAVSNGVPLFHEPNVPNAHKTLTAIVLILGLFLLGLGVVCPAYHIGVMDERLPGYQNVLSQVVAAVAGKNIFYYGALGTIFIVLTYSAQTSFADFPRVCRFLANDRFLPPAFATRGRRLVFSHGILLLAILSAGLLIIFGGITDRLIPLFAVGAFSAFLFSQLGMVRHWRRERGRHFRTKLFFNAFGALTTGAVLAIIIVAKFKEGAWLTVIVAPLAVLLLRKINQHYRGIEQQVEPPIDLQLAKLPQPAVIIPISGWNRVAEKALRFGMMLSSDITAVHVSREEQGQDSIQELWDQRVRTPAEDAHAPIPRLEVLHTPYRPISQPVVDFVNGVARQKQDRLIAVIIPEIVEPHWYNYLLHSFYATRLQMRLRQNGNDRIVVISTRWLVGHQ